MVTKKNIYSRISRINRQSDFAKDRQEEFSFAVTREKKMNKLNLVLGFMLIILLAMSGNSFATNNCLDFDGSDDYVNCGNSASLNPGNGSFTIESWIKPDVLSGTKRFIWKNDGNSTPFDGYYFMTVNSLLYAGFGDDVNTTEVAEGTLSSGSWHHVAVVRDVSADMVRLYLNGVNINENTDNTSNIDYNGDLALGGRPGESEWFDGQMDEVRIWNDARTEAEIRANMYKELAGTESNLVAYYKLNETSGTTADNAEGTISLDGTLTNMTNDYWVTSPAFFGPKNCLDFDGTDDHVDLGTDTDFETNHLTVEAWVKPSATQGWQHLVTKRSEGESANTYFQWSLQTDDTDDTYYFGVNVGGTVYWANSGVTVSTDWIHLAGTYDGETVKIYCNGILKTENTNPSGNIHIISSMKVYIATRVDNDLTGTIHFFNGKMDEVRIWNDVRTDQEIRENMCKTMVVDESGLVAYYNFDNSSGTTLQDFSGNTNDGTLTNMENADWVSSSAFNTWLNTDDATWSTTTNWSRGSAPGSTDNVGISSYTGGTAPTLNGSPAMNNLVVDDTFTLSSGLTVNGNLILENNLDLNGQTVTLGTSANLVESSGILSGTSGTIQTTRVLNNIDEDVAGLGAKITTNQNMLSTTIIRGHEAQGTLGIKRYYQVNPTTNTGLSATLVFNYLYSELNGITEADLKLFKSSDGNSWTEQSSSVVNTTNNILTLSSIDGFSWWTGGKTGAGESLPVILSSFTAQYIESIPVLCWTTQSETSNAGWNIYRGESNEALSNEEVYQLNLSLGLIPGAGTTSEPTDYSFEDVFPIIEGTTYFYWLESVDYSGESEIYGPISLTIPDDWQNPNSPEIPKPYGLHQNYPNPFNPSTEISFMLKESSIGELSIYNVKGQKIKTLFTNESIPRDELIIYNWDGKDESGKEVSTGVYYYKLMTTKGNFVRKMILLQ